MKAVIDTITSWIRRKIRVYIWKQWKKIKTRNKNLQKLEIDKNKAWEWENTKKGLWKISSSPTLQRTLTNDYIGKLGLQKPNKDILKRTYQISVTGAYRTVV
jgi:RNA-directed DNA polymerase